MVILPGLAQGIVTAATAGGWQRPAVEPGGAGVQRPDRAQRDVNLSSDEVKA
jgi:hypothetical protein